MGVYWKIQYLGGGGMGFTKTQCIGGLPKKEGAWKVCRFNGGWQERGGGAFEGGWYPNAHYELTPIDKYLKFKEVNYFKFKFKMWPALLYICQFS